MNQFPQGTVLLNGHIDVPVDRREAIEGALPSHVELTRAEPGCIFFNVDPCPETPGRYLVSEAFVDQTAFDAHQERAGASAWAEVSKDIPRDYSIEVVS